MKRFVVPLFLAIQASTAIAAPTSSAQIRSIVHRDAPRFLGEQTANLHVPNARITDAIMVFAEGDEPVVPAGEQYLFQGCRHQSCVEKGAVVVSKDARLSGFALLNFNCRLTVEDARPCSEKPRLNIYIMRSTGNASTPIESETVRVLREWGSKFNLEGEIVEVYDLRSNRKADR